MSEIIKPGIILLLITVVAAACLGIVYGITKEPIAIQKEQAAALSMQKLLPAATDFKDEISIPPESEITSVTTGYQDGNEVGYVIGVAPKGYSGKIEMLVGINTEGVLEGVQIVSQSETPGLGANAQKEAFTDQYKEKSGQLTVTKSGLPKDDEIQAITSATITSNAVTQGVNEAIDFYNNTIR